MSESENKAAETSAEPAVEDVLVEGEELHSAPPEEPIEPKHECPGCQKGAPVWMATFADMATLLMAFFVLILSFSETKVDKYKAVVGSLKNAFGMPRVQIVPSGTSITPSEYSPSISLPTPINQPNQKIEDSTREFLDRKQSPENEDFDVAKQKRMLEKVLQSEIVNSQVEVKLEGQKLVVQLKGPGVVGQDQIESTENKTAGVITPERLGLISKVSQAQRLIQADVRVEEEVDGKKAAETDLSSRDPKAYEKLELETSRQFAEIKESLKSQIEAGKVEIARRDNRIAIVIAEQGVFDDGGADIKPESVKELRAVRDAVMKTEGKVIITGHTDNISLRNNDRYLTNWDLSSARAAAVAHAMSSLLGVPQARIEIEAYADTRPIADNDTVEGRRKNRRVEILLGSS